MSDPVQEARDIATAVPAPASAIYRAALFSLITECESLRADLAAKERESLIGTNVLSVLADFGWDHAVLRAEIESGRLVETVEGCILLAIERGMRGQAERGFGRFRAHAAKSANSSATLTSSDPIVVADGERCEGCESPATGHDVDGVPLCDACGTSAENEDAARGGSDA